MTRITILIAFACALSSCSGKIPILGDLFGYTPPPEELTVSEELQQEYDRCMKIGREKNCAQWAFDIVRRVKGLEPRTVPKGVVIILEGDGGHGREDEKPRQNEQESKN